MKNDRSDRIPEGSKLTVFKTRDGRTRAFVSSAKKRKPKKPGTRKRGTDPNIDRVFKEMMKVQYSEKKKR